MNLLFTDFLKSFSSPIIFAERCLWLCGLKRFPCDWLNKIIKLKTYLAAREDPRKKRWYSTRTLVLFQRNVGLIRSEPAITYLCKLKQIFQLLHIHDVKKGSPLPLVWKSAQIKKITSRKRILVLLIIDNANLRYYWLRKGRNITSI